jgi:hypothetical protein
MNAPRETPEQTQAWNEAVAGSAEVLDTLAAEVQADLAQVPTTADDATW